MKVIFSETSPVEKKNVKHIIKNFKTEGEAFGEAARNENRLKFQIL